MKRVPSHVGRHTQCPQTALMMRYISHTPLAIHERRAYSNSAAAAMVPMRSALSQRDACSVFTCGNQLPLLSSFISILRTGIKSCKA